MRSSTGYIASGFVRVIAGSAKGRRLVGPATRDTRPLTDRAKEALFSALDDRVVDASVLDLYAGSGSIGIEALSRGARRAVFVEKGRNALAALRQNLLVCGFDQVTVIGQDVDDFLRSADGFLGTAEAAFDLVFCDPPWELATERVEQIGVSVDRLCLPGTELVVHRRYADPDPMPAQGWRHVTTRRYGDGKLCRYEKEPA